MAYSWTNTVSVGTAVKWSLIEEINTTSDYIVAHHCPSNYTSNRAHNTSVNSHNSSVWSDNSYCSDNSYSGGSYSGYWSSQNLGSRS